MIDKLDVRVPRKSPFAPEFAKQYAELVRNPKGPFRGSQHYLSSADLRPYGHGVILHTFCKHGEGDHKVEIVDAGLHSFAFSVNQIGQLFDVDPLKLTVMRFDAAADVVGVPVLWFLSHARAKFKRFSNAGIGGFEYQQLGQKGIETIYFGKRPNCFRIYNKVAEHQYQYRRLIRGLEDGTEVPSFETCFGVAPDAILTRVERQTGGGRVPEQLCTVGRLRNGAAEFDPFFRLELDQAGRDPKPEDFSNFNQYLAVLGARQLISHVGRHPFRQLVNVHTNGNASRWWKNYGYWLVDSPGMTGAELYEQYRDSVSKQLAA
jgi:hypothetical protein